MSSNRKRRSGSFGSWSLGSFFGFDDDEEEDGIPALSEFQQQSLSVFESEHMWAHFKAHLKDNNIQTAAGVRAMLPKFVDERVNDGSVISSERLVYPSSMRHQETFGANSIAVADRPVYPAAMRRQESFGMNNAIYGQLTRRQSSSRSIASSDQSSLDASGHSLCAYENVLRGDKSAFGLCGGSSEDKDLSLLASVGNRLKKKTSLDDNADRPFSQTSASPRKSALRNNSSGVFSTWSEDRDCESNAEVAVVSSPLKTETTPRRLSAESNGHGGSRPKFRRASISNGEDTPITYVKQLSSNCQNQPGRTPQPEIISSDMSALLEETLLLYSRELGESPINNKCKVPTASKVDTSYRPARKETLDHKNAHGSVPSLTSSSTGDVLLVEWGEDGESSGDEKSDDEDNPCLDDSEKAVVISRQELIEGTLNHDDKNHCISVANSRKSPNVMMALLSSISILKNEL